MPRERSAGGVVVRERDGAFELAVIQPQGKQAVALPKGHVDPGESPAEAAAREVSEETGLSVQLVADLGEIRYLYRFRGALISKTVAFFLFRHTGGEIDQLTPAMRVEVARAYWIALETAPRALSYRGEREVVAKAIEALRARDGLPGKGNEE